MGRGKFGAAQSRIDRAVGGESQPTTTIAAATQTDSNDAAR